MCIHCVTPRFARNPCRRSYSRAPLRHNGKTSQDVHRCANSPTSTSAKGTGVDKESMQPPLQLQIFNFFTCGSNAQLQPLASPTLQPWWNQESRSKGIFQSPSKEHNLPIVAIFKRLRNGNWPFPKSELLPAARQPFCASPRFPPNSWKSLPRTGSSWDPVQPPGIRSAGCRSNTSKDCSIICACAHANTCMCMYVSTNR